MHNLHRVSVLEGAEPPDKVLGFARAGKVPKNTTKTLEKKKKAPPGKMGAARYAI